jgi:hypothetical protein
VSAHVHHPRWAQDNHRRASTPSPEDPFRRTIAKALARAHSWKQKLEDGTYATVGELARAERINESYVTRILRLNLLAPDIVEAALSDTVDGTEHFKARLTYLGGTANAANGRAIGPSETLLERVITRRLLPP